MRALGSEINSCAIEAAEREVRVIGNRLATSETLRAEAERAAGQIAQELAREKEEKHQLGCKYDRLLLQERKRGQDNPQPVADSQQVEALRLQLSEARTLHQAEVEDLKQFHMRRYSELEAHNRKLVQLGQASPAPEITRGTPGGITGGTQQELYAKCERAWGRVYEVQMELEETQLQGREAEARLQAEVQHWKGECEELRGKLSASSSSVTQARQVQLQLEELSQSASREQKELNQQAARLKQELQAMTGKHQLQQDKLVVQLNHVTEALEVSTNEVTRLGAALFEQSARMEAMETNVSFWKTKVEKMQRASSEPQTEVRE